MVIGLRGETHADQKLALRDDSLGLSAPRPGVRSRAGAARQNAVRRCIVHHATKDSLCGMGTTKRRRYSRAGCNPSDNFACVHFTQKETSVFVHARRRHCFVAGISRGVFLVCCTGQRSISRSSRRFKIIPHGDDHGSKSHDSCGSYVSL